MSTPPPPVRIKLYGLFAVTRRGYLVILIIGVLLLGVLFGVWVVWVTRSLPAEAPAEGPGRMVPLLLNHLYLLVLFLAVLLGLEAYVVFRRFARAEALRRQQRDEQPLTS